MFPREAVACSITDPVIDIALDTTSLLPNISATFIARRYLAGGYVLAVGGHAPHRHRHCRRSGLTPAEGGGLEGRAGG